MTRKMLQALLVAAALYLGLCFLAFLLQARLVYFPGPPPGLRPSDLGLEYQDLTLETDDQVALHAWFLPAPETIPAKGVVLFSHGNAGSIEHRLEGAQSFLEMGLSVLLFDYRGYGNSAGSPSEQGTYLDAQAAHDWLVESAGFDPSRIVAYGESLGAGVAIELALRRRVGAVIAESAFTSVAGIGARAYPFLPVRLLARIRYDNLEKVPRLAVPLLAIHSRDDELVPFSLGRELFEAAREPKQFLETRGGHNDGGFLRSESARAAVRAFIERSLAR